MMMTSRERQLGIEKPEQEPEPAYLVQLLGQCPSYGSTGQSPARRSPGVDFSLLPPP